MVDVRDQAFTRRFGLNCRQYDALIGAEVSTTTAVVLLPPVTVTWKATPALRSTRLFRYSRSRRSSTACGRRRRAPAPTTTPRPLPAATRSASAAGRD